METGSSAHSSESDAPETNRRFASRISEFAYTAAPIGSHAGRKLCSKDSPNDTPPPRNAPLTPSTTASRPKRTRSNTADSSQKSRKSSRLVSRKPNVKLRNWDVATGLSPKKVKPRTTAKERSASDPLSPENKLVDMLRPGLILVMIGLNPGLETARTGLAYAHHTNLFYKLLFSSGLTPVLHEPTVYPDIMDLYSIGNTNIIARPTRAGVNLTKEDVEEGQPILERKIAEFRPEAVCIVGKGVWEMIYKAKTGKNLTKEGFQWGWQDESLWLGRAVDGDRVIWPGSRTFVSTSTSGLAASLKPDEKAAIWRPLGKWFRSRKAELVENDGSSHFTSTPLDSESRLG